MSKHCDQYSDIISGKSMKELPELAAVVNQIARDSATWTTVFECQICGQVWEEAYEQAGHGEVPSLHKLAAVL